MMDMLGHLVLYFIGIEVSFAGRFYIITYYIQCTGKYHESVARIGTSATGMSTKTGNGRASIQVTDERLINDFPLITR